jgi:hypothetical protein
MHRYLSLDRCDLKSCFYPIHQTDYTQMFHFEILGLLAKRSGVKYTFLDTGIQRMNRGDSCAVFFFFFFFLAQQRV